MSAQQPLPSGFGPTTTAREVIGERRLDGVTIGSTPSQLAGRLSTEVVAAAVPGARVVKAFNTMFAAVLAEDPVQNGGHRVVFISGNDDAANREVAALVERLGFAPVALGPLAEGGKLQQFGAPLAGLNLVQHPNPKR